MEWNDLWASWRKKKTPDFCMGKLSNQNKLANIFDSQLGFFYDNMGNIFA